MSNKKLDSLIPSFLDQKSKSRKQIRFSQGFVVASYENSGTLNICHLPTKKLTRLELSTTHFVKHIDVKGTRILFRPLFSLFRQAERTIFCSLNPAPGNFSPTQISSPHAWIQRINQTGYLFSTF
jgi:hypothetical protein